MTQRHLSRDRTPPLWAVLGAPLIGVPIMVGLLALSRPKVETPRVEPVPARAAEPIETDVVDPVSNDSAALIEVEPNAG